MADIDVAIFTFTATEDRAVRTLLERLTEGPPDAPRWDAVYGRLEVMTTLQDGRVARVRHRHLNVQGNVTAARELVREAIDHSEADYYVFYGCCGALNGSHVGQVYRVSRVSYLSLGSVRPATGEDPLDSSTNETVPSTSNAMDTAATADGAPVNDSDGDQIEDVASVREVVKLKNKWIVHTADSVQAPLGSIALPSGSATAPGRLRLLTIPDAYVLATDKVITVPPAPNAPPPANRDHTGTPFFEEEEWTYGEALAHCATYLPDPVLIDMETYGLASALDTLRLGWRVLVLRVVTDALTNKNEQGDDQQQDLLMARLPVLADALATIIGITDGS
ncbi:hypothetical protein [Mycobacterium sp. DBP42]|uniref:hypothetical protein n=1 Tax=Mycobacterium sp. DBP42 TaxID=2545267 RepID=UPI00110D08C2|nr:hypothetical protein [Mycobacterium sp. DBP42]TMS45964.1 hypothetical protein E0T84_30345 [Mycobacterium sp. DBP42]